MFEYIEARAKQLKLEIDTLLSNVAQPALRGQHAEEILKKFLTEVLPMKYSVGTGLVMASDGTISKQTDVIIYDAFNNPPITVLGGFNIYPSESVYAVISVKISLTSTNLLSSKANSFDNINSVKMLPKNDFLVKNIGPGVSVNGDTSKTLGIVFGFLGTIRQETLAKAIEAKHLDEGITIDAFNGKYADLICNLSKGIIIVNPKKHGFRSGMVLVETPLAVTSGDGGNHLLDFTLALITLLNQQTLMPVNIYAYGGSRLKGA